MNTSLLPRRIFKESWRWGKLHQSVIAGVAYLASLWVPVGDVEGAGGPGDMGTVNKDILRLGWLGHQWVMFDPPQDG